MFLGIDIGTTSICAVVLDEKAQVVYTVTESNSFGSVGKNEERTQDAQKIFALCQNIYDDCKQKFQIKGIGVSGQMHGILYVDADGKAISPLYSWQDGRGNLPYNNSTYAQTLSSITNYTLATGYGTVSVYYDLLNNNIPQSAVSFCTIGDFVAMQLANSNKPVINQTNAASLGLYDIENGCWDKIAIEKSGIPFDLFPTVTTDVICVGKTDDGASVFTSIGDNQASVYGAAKTDNSIIVNIGTGSQISVITDKWFSAPKGTEIRPYFNGKYLALGCALCGGYSIKLLKDFFNAVNSEISYKTINDWAESVYENDTPSFNPLFRGTRNNPNLLANIDGISENNFTPQSIALALFKGVSGELKAFYDLLAPFVKKSDFLVGAGNAIRLNSVLKRIVEDDYGLTLNVPAHKEEAAFGAALIAGEKTLNSSMKNFIKYEVSYEKH